MFQKYCLLQITLLFLCLTPNRLCSQQNIDPSYSLIIDSIGANLKIGRINKNIEYIKELESSEALDGFNCLQLGTIYHKLGQAYYILLDHPNAFRTFTNKTIPIWSNCSMQSTIDEAHSYHAAALSGQYLNYFDKAISLMNISLEYYESDSTYSEFNLARKYHGAGVLYSNTEDFELAEIYYLQSIELFSKSEKAGRHLSLVYNDLGVIYQKKKEYLSAIAEYEKSLVQSDTYKTDNLHNISNAYIELEDFQNAGKYALLTYESAQEQGDTTIIARTLELIGFVQYLLNNQSKALKAYNDQIDLLLSDAQNNETSRYLAKAYENISLCYLKLGKNSLAMQANEKAINYMFFEERLDQFNNPIIYENNTRNESETIDILSTKADILQQIRRKNDQSIAAQEEIDIYFKIDSLFLTILSDISFTRSKFYLLSTINPLYEKAITTLINNYSLTGEINYFNKAYFFASKLKAITLRSSINSGKIISKEDKLKLQSHKKSIDSLKLIYYNSPGRTDSVSSKIIKHQRFIHTFNKSLSKRYPELAKLNYDNIQNIEYQQIRKQISNSKLVIEYFQGDSSLYSFFMAKDTFGVLEIKLDDTFQSLINQFINASHTPRKYSVQEYREIAFKVFGKLINPLVSKFNHSIKEILIVPDGLTHSIPFEALCNENLDFLIKDYEISYAYSYQMRTINRDVESKGYVGFAASYTSDLNNKVIQQQAAKKELILADIPLAITEITNSAKIFSGKTFLNDKATKQAFLENTKDVSIIHLSTHGIIDHEVPENSNLLFHDGEDDFILHSSEINTLNLNSDLVVLSACQTGAGKTHRNEGVLGISRSFILAGASSLISSLWNASEYTSSLVLPLFFENYAQGKSKAKALQLAKIEYLNKARPSLKHPFYWSNLILISNPSYTQDGLMNTYTIPAICLISILIIIGFILVRKLKKT